MSAFDPKQALRKCPSGGIYCATYTLLSDQPRLAICYRNGFYQIWNLDRLVFLIFVPLALTYNDASIRTLAQIEPLQRFVYPAAVLTLLHWIFVNNDLGPALVHFVPLAALEIYRVRYNARRSLPIGAP